MSLPACPHCGRVVGFLVNATFRVSVEEQYSPTGQVESSPETKWGARQSRDVVRCENCGKTRRDVICVADAIVIA